MKREVYRMMIFLSFFTLLACSDFSRVPEEKFVGTWELSGRKIYEGLKVDISLEGDKLVGRLIQLNDNKYVRLFVDSNSVWIPEIERSSNYQFVLTENKIGKELFSLYGLPTSQKFKVEFISDDKFGLALDSDPLKSSIIYKKVK